MVNLKQLHLFLRNIDQKSLSASAQYLTKEVPSRLSHLSQAFRSEPSVSKDISAAHEDLAVQMSKSANLLSNFLPEALDDAQNYYVQNVDQAFSPVDQALTQYFKLVQVSISKDSNLKRSRALQDLISKASSTEIAVKIMLEHHLYAFEKLKNGNVQDPAFKRFGVVQDVTLAEIVSETVSHVQALSISHFGTHPRIEVVSRGLDARVTGLMLESQIHYVIMELLKNSVKSLVDKYGALDLDRDETPPIKVILSGNVSDGLLGIQIQDEGTGIPIHLRNRSSTSSSFRLFDYFSSTKKEDPNPTYTYSRQFGPPFSGFGTGLATSKKYVELIHGGRIEISSLPRCNTITTFWIDRFGGGEF